jgi:hypothetical protein
MTLSSSSERTRFSSSLAAGSWGTMAASSESPARRAASRVFNFSPALVLLTVAAEALLAQDRQHLAVEGFRRCRGRRARREGVLDFRIDEGIHGMAFAGRRRRLDASSPRSWQSRVASAKTQSRDFAMPRVDLYRQNGPARLRFQRATGSTCSSVKGRSGLPRGTQVRRTHHDLLIQWRHKLRPVSVRMFFPPTINSNTTREEVFRPGSRCCSENLLLMVAFDPDSGMRRLRPVALRGSKPFSPLPTAGWVSAINSPSIQRRDESTSVRSRMRCDPWRQFHDHCGHAQQHSGAAPRSTGCRRHRSAPAHAAAKRHLPTSGTHLLAVSPENWASG